MENDRWVEEVTKTVVEAYKSKWSIVHDQYVEDRLSPLVLNALKGAFSEGAKSRDGEVEKLEGLVCTCSDNPHESLCRACYIKNALEVCKEHESLKSQLAEKEKSIHILGAQVEDTDKLKSRLAKCVEALRETVEYRGGLYCSEKVKQTLRVVEER